MRKPDAAMHVAKIKRQRNGRTYVSYLLRRSYRQGGRVRHPGSQTAAARHWNGTTLAEELRVAQAGYKPAYAALGWLLARQRGIENKLAKKHLGEGAVVLYDVSSSSYEGHTCPLAQYG